MKRFLLPILITLFLISASAVFTLNFRALYYHDISSLNIEEISGYSEHVIRENYNALIDYNSIFHRDPLDLSLPMSREGRIHFQDVKRIFDVLQIICLITLTASLILGIRSWKQGCRKFLRNSAILSVLLPAAAGILIASNCENAFILFHEIMFSNDYWIFDERTYPVIQILPDEFFLHCALMIIALILAASLCMGLIYLRQTHQKNNSSRLYS